LIRNIAHLRHTAISPIHHPTDDEQA